MSKKKKSEMEIEKYEHKDKERLNNPPVGLVSSETDVVDAKNTYRFDPHLDPKLNWDARKLRDEFEEILRTAIKEDDPEKREQLLEPILKASQPWLEWAGKAEHTNFEVDTVSLYVHERIDPYRVVNEMKKEKPSQTNLDAFFELPHNNPPLREAVEFYKHRLNWTNRLISGDSLLVMNSLLEKEGMAGKVQMIYIDPPYGVKYGSNFQPFVNKRDVKDGKDEDLTQEPETIKAYRDTWELGIHSYLTYLRDRLLLARELLTESGSIFVQISDENVHHVREIMDEVFGKENFQSLITFRTAISTNNIFGISDYLIWYSKNNSRIKKRSIFIERPKEKTDTTFTHEDMIGRSFKPTDEIWGSSKSALFEPYELEGISHTAPRKKGYKWGLIGMKRLKVVDRLWASKKQLYGKKYPTDFSYMNLTNLWSDTSTSTFSSDKIYAVQTNTKVIERCLLMTTDPGDLVLDPTCGSGTTAYVAEKWGRRWITIDTSRVAISLAKIRLMTAVFPYYSLAYPDEGVGSGFVYKTVPHITLKSIANNPEIDEIYGRYHPKIEEALLELNRILKEKGAPPFAVNSGGRKGHTIDFSLPDSEVMKLPSADTVPAGALLEWEVPHEFPAGWPDDAQYYFDTFWRLKREMQNEMDENIKKHAPQETLYDQPETDSSKIRVTGPFTVESVPAPRVKPIDEIEVGAREADVSVSREGETDRVHQWMDELLRTGVRARSGSRIMFSRLEPMPGSGWLHLDGETDDGKRVVVSFGPTYAPMDSVQVEQAIQEASHLVPRPSLVIFASFQFDPEAAKDIDETDWPSVNLLKVQMNTDLLTEDLKKKRSSNQSFWLIGQPDVELRKREDGRYEVEVNGFDYYNPITGNIESGGKGRIAMWMLDTDYDGRSIYPSQIFLPMAGEKEGWKKLEKALKGQLDSEKVKSLFGTISLPFEPGNSRNIAVKIVDDRGIESIRILEVD